MNRNDRGSSLIIALAFLALLSLWVSATLAATQTGLHISQTMRVEPGKLYGADGAIEQTIQKIRRDPNRGIKADGSCGTTASVNGHSYFVQCQPDQSSGVSPNGGSSPSLGIIALTDGYRDPLNPSVIREVGFTQRKNGVIKVDGGLFSNAGISFQNGSTCPGTNCQQLNLCPNNVKTVNDAIFLAANSGPNTPSKTVTSFTANFQSVNGESDVGAPITGPNITGTSTIAAVAGPTSITMAATAKSVATGQQITFRENYPPTNALCHPDPGKAKGDLRVVGMDCPQSSAVAVNFFCNASATDPLNPNPVYPPDSFTFTPRTVPSSSPCPTSRVVTFSPGKYTDVVGLNNLMNCSGKIFYFQPGTYYFDFSGAGSPVWTMNNPSSWIIAGARTWDARGDGSGLFTADINKDSTTVSWKSGPTFTSSETNNHYLVGGLDMPVAAQVKYVNSTTLQLVDAKKAPGSKIAGGTFALTDSSDHDSPCDRGDAAGHDHPGAEFIFGGPSQVSLGDMRFELCAPAAGNSEQIGIYGVKTALGDLVAENGCVVAQPYPAAGCALIYSQPTRSPIFIVHGTVYAPAAPVDLTVKNLTYQAITRGLVARTVALEMYPNAAFTDPVIYSPDFGLVFGADRLMVLTACEDGSVSSCSKARLRALVRIRDHDENNFTKPGFKVTIESWTVCRVRVDSQSTCSK